MSTQERSLTLQELLHEARAAGFEPTERLVHDWVALGLLDRPHARGRGRGRGVERTWPESQLKLLLLLLAKRREVKWVTTLCNIPVGMWIYFGDQHIGLPQVRRALKTWADRYQRGSWRAAMITGRQMASEFAGPDARPTDVERLVRLIATAGFRGRLDEAVRSDLVAELHKVAPEPWRDTVPEAYAHLIEARLAAIDHLAELSDEQFRAGRALQLQAIANYLPAQPSLGADPDLGGLFGRPDFTKLMNEACPNLLTFLGVQLIAPERVAAMRDRSMA